MSKLTAALKKAYNSPSGIQVSVSVGDIKTGWGFFRRLFHRQPKDELLEEFKADYQATKNNVEPE